MMEVGPQVATTAVSASNMNTEVLQIGQPEQDEPELLSLRRFVYEPSSIWCL
jgi:hypothetical protein